MGWPKGKSRGPMSEEHKRNIGAGLMGHSCSEETKRKIGEASTGRRHSEETKRKISKAKTGQSIWPNGRVFSEETKQKMSEAHKGQVPWCTGKNLSKEHRENVSKGVKKLWDDPEYRELQSETHRGTFAGENHWNWQGGITSEQMKIRNSFEMAAWRRAVFERDNYTCMRCDTKGGTLHAHHLVPFASEYGKELHFSVGNGWTLCRDCHMDIHAGRSSI